MNYFSTPAKLFLFVICPFIFLTSIGYTFYLNHKVVSENRNNIDSLKAEQRETKILLEYFIKPLDSLPIEFDEKMYFDQKKLEIENKIVNQSARINKLENEIKANHESWYLEFFKFNGVVAALIGFIIGLFGIQLYIKKWLWDGLASLLELDREKIKEIWNAKIKNRKLRDSIKLKVLAEKGSIFSDDFKKVMKIFKVNLDDNEKIIWTVGLKDVYKKILDEEFDILIIENKKTKKEDNIDKAEWPITNTQNMTSIEELEDKLITEKEKAENALSLLKLANKVCDKKRKKAIVYYGDSKNGFPSNLVKEDYQHRVTFANAASQLYGNINNMIQFQHEIGELKSKL